MTPIKLTKEHKKKLLEMCKMLFLELHKKAFNNGVLYYGSKKEALVNDCGFYITGNNHIQCSYPTDDRDDSFHDHLIESTHWLEFCIYHIIPKLKLKLLWTDSVYEDVLLRASHPVDYLYVEFKRLK